MSADMELLREAAKTMRKRANAATPGPRDPVVALAVADWLDREARRVGPHAITTHKVREDWYIYDCATCGVGGSVSKAGLATWQEQHVRLRRVADNAAVAVARAFLGKAEQ